MLNTKLVFKETNIYFILCIECHSKKSKGVCACAIWDCCSWSWGNRYFMPFNVKLMYFFLWFVYILFDSKFLYENCESYPYNCVTSFSYFLILLTLQNECNTCLEMWRTQPLAPLRQRFHLSLLTYNLSLLIPFPCTL